MKKSFFILLLVLAACTSSKKEVPPGILSHQQMVSVLIEVHLLEAKIKRLYLPSDSSQAVYKHYENMLLKDMGISPEVYNNSLEYYMDKIDEMESIYQEVVDSLLARQSAMEVQK